MKKTALALALTTAVVGTAMADGNWKTGTGEMLKSNTTDCIAPGVSDHADDHCGAHVHEEVKAPAPKPVVVTPPPAPKPVVVAPAPKPVVVAPVSFTLESDASFATASAKLKSSARATLNDFAAKALAADANIRQIVISGHADSTGRKSFNQKLSQNRANAVRKYLIAQGVSASKISATGYGDSQPVASNATAAGRAQNRRAEIRVVTK